MACILIVKDPVKRLKWNMFYLVLGFGVSGSSCMKEDIDIDLTANDWEVELIKESGKLSFTGTENTYILHFASNKEYHLSLDVNTCQGIYEIPGKGDIEMQAMGCTKMCCDSEFAEDLAGLFPKMTGYYSKGERLYFEGDGKIVLQPR